MKRSIFSLVALLASVLLFSGCQRDHVSGQLTLVAEGMNHGGKMAVDGYSAAWATGDPVRINGEEVTVSVDGGSATVSSATTFTAPFYGVYPSGIYADNSGGATYTLELPATYEYATSGGLQNLHSPMVAYSESGSTLTFKHLTAAIGVQVVNYHYDYDIVVDSIVVISDKYKLWGETTVVLGNELNVSPVTSATAADRRVKMTFGSGMAIAASGSAVVQIPVLPVGDDNKFTVKIVVHRADQPSVSAILSREQSVGGELARAYLAVARYCLGGPFSVSASKKVIFSKGNLQYQASTGTWRFAENQYDCIGNNPGNNADSNTRKTQEDWIDLFCWGASGYDNKYPYTKIPMNYTAPTDITETNYDWGVYNEIDGSTGWYTLKWNNMNYVLNTRTANRYMKARIGTVYGLIVFPDSYIHPEGVAALTNANTASTAWESTYDATSYWSKMELVGAIFMPAAGYNRGYGDYGIMSVNSIGQYWMATYGSNKATYFQISTSTVSSSSMVPANNIKSVRLVRDVN